jgi:hypothetical protein
MKEQVIRLYSCIQWACGAARRRKRALRMLLDAEELQSYLQCAFEHYAKTLDFPFDFVEASFTLSPIPLDFGGNILKLALNLMDAETDARVIFQKLGYMVASCIMLDSVRHKIKGSLVSPVLHIETYANDNRDCRSYSSAVSQSP